ncbi:hypothetical protein EDEG_00840 [Edhazardia aedis USNM 41457]|uniref:Uncharacterized protein n=1 Tax=Edhazardia aedis (strain USNM 41457) TaxID=1003232 RepID=J9DC64_EDHAE|nr:hypothetical protein EDEG_00840 [Edhazardia aedis USNM 41457]|eukprot:EJW05059.1 hypothetical protein EDEG_00840 [Edhazardia aedis USNM 41457]
MEFWEKYIKENWIPISLGALGLVLIFILITFLFSSTKKKQKNGPSTKNKSQNSKTKDNDVASAKSNKKNIRSNNMLDSLLKPEEKNIINSDESDIIKADIHSSAPNPEVKILRSEYASNLYNEFSALIDDLDKNNWNFSEDTNNFEEFLKKYISLTNNFWKYFQAEAIKDICSIDDKKSLDDLKSNVVRVSNHSIITMCNKLDRTRLADISETVKYYNLLVDFIDSIFKLKHQKYSTSSYESSNAFKAIIDMKNTDIYKNAQENEMIIDNELEIKTSDPKSNEKLECKIIQEMGNCVKIYFNVLETFD